MNNYSKSSLLEEAPNKVLDSLGDSTSDDVDLGPQHKYLTAFAVASPPDDDIRKLAPVFNRFDDFTKLTVHLRDISKRKAKKSAFKGYSREEQRSASCFITTMLYIRLSPEDRLIAKKYYYDNIELLKSNKGRSKLPEKHPLEWEAEFVYNLIGYVDTERFEVNVAALVLKSRQNYGATVEFDDNLITALSRKVIMREDRGLFPPDYNP